MQHLIKQFKLAEDGTFLCPACGSVIEGDVTIRRAGVPIFLGGEDDEIGYDYDEGDAAGCMMSAASLRCSNRACVWRPVVGPAPIMLT